MSATVTGVCGLSWEVTMAVLPRLYLKEVLSELQRRRIAVGREKILRQQELTHLLKEVMACEYEQLQQHLKGTLSEELSPPTRTSQDVTTSDAPGGHYIHNTRGNLPGFHSSHGSHGNTSQSVAQISPNQGISPVSSAAQQNLQAQKRAKNTLPGNLSGIHRIHGNAVQGVVRNSPNQGVEATSHATATQQNLQPQPAQTRAKNTLPGNLPRIQAIPSNTVQGVAQNSPNQVVEAISHATAIQQNLQPQLTQTRAKNTLPVFPSNTAQGVAQNSPNQVVEAISHMTAVQQDFQAQLTQVVADFKKNVPKKLPGIKTRDTGPHTDAPVHGSSFTNGQTDRLLMQVSPQIQVSPQVVPPHPTQMIRKGLAEVAKLPNMPVKLLPRDGNSVGKIPSEISMSQPSPQPPRSQNAAQGNLLIPARLSTSAMQQKPEVALAQGLHKGVATNGSHSNTAPSLVHSSSNQLVQGVSLNTARQQQYPKTQPVTKNALPATRTPASIHTEQGNVSRNSVSNTPVTSSQTHQAFSLIENTSPYTVGQANLMLEPTEAGNRKPGHQDVQGTLYTNNTNTTRDVSFQSVATGVEKKKDEYTNKSSTNTPTQASVASQQILLTLNQQLASENFSRTSSDSITQQSPEQDSTQSIQHGEGSVQDPCETEDTNNFPANVVVKTEPDDDLWSVPCTTSAAKNDNSGIPFPSVVIKTEIDDNVETGSTLPVDYSVRSLMEEGTVQTENSMEGALGEDTLDYASSEHSPVTSSTPVQQPMPQDLLTTHTEQHDTTPTATLPLTEPLTVGTTLSQENSHSSSGFPSPDFTAYVRMCRGNKNQAQKRKTVRALLEDLKRAKQLKVDGLTDEVDPLGIVSAMKDKRVRQGSYSQTNSGADVGPSVPPAGVVLVQQQRTGNMQVVQEQGGLSPQFPLAPTEANKKARALAPKGVLHKCMFCPFETRLRTNLQHHLRDHADINVYRCGKCNFSAAAKQTLDDHVATQHHDELPFMCGVCGYRTGVKDNLSTHMWVVHKAEKGFQCSLCDYRTSYKPRLETHIITHHF